MKTPISDAKRTASTRLERFISRQLMVSAVLQSCMSWSIGTNFPILPAFNSNPNGAFHSLCVGEMSCNLFLSFHVFVNVLSCHSHKLFGWSFKRERFQEIRVLFPACLIKPKLPNTYTLTCASQHLIISKLVTTKFSIKLLREMKNNIYECAMNNWLIAHRNDEMCGRTHNAFASRINCNQKKFSLLKALERCRHTRSHRHSFNI